MAWSHHPEVAMVEGSDHPGLGPCLRTRGEIEPFRDGVGAASSWAWRASRFEQSRCCRERRSPAASQMFVSINSIKRSCQARRRAPAWARSSLVSVDAQFGSPESNDPMNAPSVSSGGADP